MQNWLKVIGLQAMQNSLLRGKKEVKSSGVLNRAYLKMWGYLTQFF